MEALLFLFFDDFIELDVMSVRTEAPRPLHSLGPLNRMASLHPVQR